MMTSSSTVVKTPTTEVTNLVEGMFSAARAGATDRLLSLVQKHRISLECVDSQGFTCLMVAVKHGHHECVRRLLEAKANVNHTNTNDRSAFFYVGDTTMADILYNGGGNPNHVARRTGETPLLMAAAAAATTHLLIEWFVGHDANVNATLSDGTTPLMLACEQAVDEVCVRTLLANQANINQTNRSGNTALHYACENHTHQHARAIVSVLLAGGADMAARRRNGDTPYTMAQGTSVENVFAEYVARADQFANEFLSPSSSSSSPPSSSHDGDGDGGVDDGGGRKKKKKKKRRKTTKRSEQVLSQQQVQQEEPSVGVEVAVATVNVDNDDDDEKASAVIDHPQQFSKVVASTPPTTAMKHPPTSPPPPPPSSSLYHRQQEPPLYRHQYEWATATDAEDAQSYRVLMTAFNRLDLQCAELDLNPMQFLGHGLLELSPSQLSALESLHTRMLTEIRDAKVELANRRTSELEQHVFLLRREIERLFTQQHNNNKTA